MVFDNIISVENCNEFVICKQIHPDDDQYQQGPANAVAKVYYMLKNEPGRNYAGYTMNLSTALTFNETSNDVILKKVVLLEDCSISNLVVDNGVIFDVNGYVVSASRRCIVDGEVIDSQNGKGGIVARIFMIDSIQTLCMPLYDNDMDGYRFFNYSVRFGRDATTHKPDWSYLAMLAFTNMKAYELLATGEAGLTLNATISLKENENADATVIDWRLSKESMIAYANEQLATGSAVKQTVGVKLSGLNEFEGWILTVELYLESIDACFYKTSGPKSATIPVASTTTN